MALNKSPRFPMLLALAALIGGGGLLLAMMAISREHQATGSVALPSLLAIWLAAGAMGAALSLLAWRLRQDSPVATVDTARTASHRRAWLVILLTAAAFRIAFALLTTPALSDDIYRYIHDGAQLARSQNPYQHPPAHYLDGSPREAPHPPVLEHINHPELVTIYQPASQWIFAGAWKLTPLQRDPIGHLTLRLVLIVFDLLLIALLLRVLSVQGRSPWWAALYAWHPLPLIEVAATGHQDVIGVLFIVLAVMLAIGAATCSRRALGAGACFAIAIACKPIVLPLAAPFAWHLRRQPKRLLLAALATLAAGLALYLPFILMPGGITGLFDTFGQYHEHWQFNGPVHWLIRQALGKTAADILTTLLLLAVLLISIRRGWDLWRIASLYFLAWLLLSPTAYPWYLLWALAFLPIRFSLTTWVFSFTILLTYEVKLHPDQWWVPVWLNIVEFLPVYTAMFWSFRRRAAGRDRPARP